MLFWFVIVGGVIFLAEYYFYQAVKNVISSAYHYLWFLIELLWILLIAFTIFLLFFYHPHQWKDVFRFFLSIIFIIEISKLFGSIFMFLDDIRRLFMFCISSVCPVFDQQKYELLRNSRVHFFSKMAMFFTFLPFAGFIYGIIRGAYNYKIHLVNLSFSEFPRSFDGLKIVQISDLHLGSFFSTRPVEKIVELVNAEQADIIVFTGDLVNNLAEEVELYKSILSKLKASLGIYSILGNHDYGDYISWESESKKKDNLQRLINIQKEMGWDILLNEHRIIEKNGEFIAIIGVENWGGNLKFPRYGRLDKAYKGIEHIPFKILLSHDPSHWELEVNKYYPDIQLTLSGHTHGFQFGVEYGNIKFSPVQWVYKHWAGLYEKRQKKLFAQNNAETKVLKNQSQYLYVNRGAGFIGYPGRLGIWPEITVIELRHKA